MTVHELLNPHQRDERTEHRRRLERVVDELVLIGEALGELSRHRPSRLLCVLAKSQQRQVDDLHKLLAYAFGAGSAAATALGDFDDDVPF